ncbi:Vancomycin B-type resistance protein VanW [compost metagenome]
MTGRVKVGAAIAVGAIAIAPIVAALWLNRPFQAELAAYRTSLADRTEAQRHNIRQAVMALDGVVIESGATFSFNETVGPRTQERGYREAPAFMERELVTSVGGGICQVSSTLYNAAVLSGFEMVERHPHFRQVVSVQPGRDATVWYAMADLRFKNIFLHPIRLSLQLADEVLSVAVQGNEGSVQQVQVFTEIIPSPNAGVSTYQTHRTMKLSNKLLRREVLSVDVYNSH